MTALDKAPNLSEQFKGRIAYFKDKKYEEVANDTPQNQINRSKKIIKYLRSNKAFPNKQLKSENQPDIDEVIALYQNLINKNAEQKIQKPQAETKAIVIPTLADSLNNKHSDINATKIEKDILALAEKNEEQEKAKKLERIRQKSIEELKAVTDEKLNIFKSDNLVDIKNAITSLLEQKAKLQNLLTNENDKDILNKYETNIDVHVQDYILYLYAKGKLNKKGDIKPLDIQKYITETLGISTKQVDIKNIIEILSQKNKIQYTDIQSLREAVQEKTLFQVRERKGTNGDYLFSYSPIVIVNLKNGEKIPTLLATQIEKLRKQTIDKKRIPVFAKIHEVKRDVKQSKETININKELVKEAVKSYYENLGNIALLKTGKFQVDSDSTNDEYKQNTAKGRIGKHFEGRKGVHCAEYVAMYLNAKLNLPKGRVIAGDAWTMIENLKAGKLITEITARKYPNKYTISKSPYNNAYKTRLEDHYQQINEAFNKSNMPMILGVHFLRTATDIPSGNSTSRTGRGALLHAQAQYANKTKDRYGNLKVRYKPTANSHVFALEKNFSRNIEGENRTLPQIFKQLWNGNRHKRSEGRGANLDLNSPLIADLDVEYTNKNGEIISKKAGDLLNSGKEFTGRIVVKGLGMSDEIGGRVKKAFFAFRMSTRSGGKAMYTFVQAGQISEKNLVEDEKSYNSVMNGIDVSYTELSTLETNQDDWKYTLENFYGKNKIPKFINITNHKSLKYNRNISKKDKNILLSRYYEKLKETTIEKNFTGDIKKYSHDYFKVRALYAQFFRISGVQKTEKRGRYPSYHLKLPVFSSKEDVLKAADQHDKELTKKLEHLNTSSGFVQIGESANKNSVKSINDLMKAFVNKASELGINIKDIDITKPAVKKEFFMFLQSIGNFNKHSYFDAVMDESVKYSDVTKNEIFSQFFLYSSKVYFTKEHLQDLENNLRKAEYSVKKAEIKKTEEVFNEIPFDVLRNKLGYPLSAEELDNITNGNAEKMRALILIWIRETAWGKEYLLEKRGKEHGTIDNIITWAINKADSIHANLRHTASAGDWQVKVPIIKPEIKNIALNMDVLLKKTSNLLKQVSKLKNIPKQSQEFSKDFKHLEKVLNNVQNIKISLEKEGKTITTNNAEHYHTLKTTLVRFYEKYPQAGAIMAVSHMEDIQPSIYTQLKNAQIKGEKVTQRQLYDFVINSWSSPVANAQAITVNILDNLVNKYGLTDVYTKIDEKTNALIEKKDGPAPNFLPNKIRAMFGETVGPSEKGKIRIIEMTRRILTFLETNNKDAKIIKNEILEKIRDDIEGDTDDQKLKNFFKKVKAEITASEKNPKSKALFLATQKLESGSDIKTANTANFSVLFTALRSVNPEINLKLNTEIITDKEKKQMGNYLGYADKGLNTLFKPLTQKEQEAKENNREVANKILKITKIIKNGDNFNLKENKELAKKIQQMLFDLGLYTKRIGANFGPISRKAMSAIDEKKLANQKTSIYSKSDIQKLLQIYEARFIIQRKPSNNSTQMLNFLERKKAKMSNENKEISTKQIIQQLENLKLKYSEKNSNTTVINLRDRASAKVIQQLLQKFGVYDALIDGIFGRGSQNALRSIGAIQYSGGLQLTLSDIKALISFYKENQKRIDTFGSNAVETPIEVNAIENIKQELNDEFLTKYSDNMVTIGKLSVMLGKIIGLENSKTMNNKKIQNLKNRVLQILLKMLGYYNEKIDGGFGKKSQNAFTKFLQKNPNIELKENYLLSIISFLQKQEIKLRNSKFSGVLKTPNFQKYVNTKLGNSAKFAPNKSQKKINPDEYPFKKNKVYLIATGDGHHSGFLTVNSDGEKLFSHAGINFIQAKNGKMYDYSQSDQYKKAIMSGDFSKLRNVTNLMRVTGKNNVKYFRPVDTKKDINLTFNGTPIQIDPNQKQGGFHTVKWEDYCFSNPKDTKSVYIQELSTKNNSDLSVDELENLVKTAITEEKVKSSDLDSKGKFRTHKAAFQIVKDKFVMNKDTVRNGHRLTDMAGMKEKTVQGMLAFHDLLVEKKIIPRNGKLRFSGGAEKGGGHKHDNDLKDKNNHEHDPLSHGDGDKFDISYRDFPNQHFKGNESSGRTPAMKIVRKLGGVLKSRIVQSGNNFEYYEITHNGITMEIHVEKNHFDIGIVQ